MWGDSCEDLGGRRTEGGYTGCLDLVYGAVVMLRRHHLG